MSRFEYIKYDEHATKIQELFKNQVSSIEEDINEFLFTPVEKFNALMKLEELYMWIGKCIKKDQEKRKDG